MSEPRLRPFFKFFGGKWRDTPAHYPPPAYDTIVEPFAGSAGFSLRYPTRDVVLCDIDPIIAGLWRYLIGVDADEIRSIPDIGPQQTVDDLDVCQEARWLVGFWLNSGVTAPRRSPSVWMRSGIRPGSSWGERVRETVASQVDSIRHWQVVHGSYDDLDVTGPATWFVDPPYVAVGHHYRCGSKGLDYAALAAWCRTRRGQVIVSEQTGADWLPFEHITHIKTTRPGVRSAQAVWIGDQP